MRRKLKLFAYASACNGEVLLGEREPTPLFPQARDVDRFKAREEYVLRKTEENSRAVGRSDLSSKAFKVGYYDMAYLQILWSADEVRRLPAPLGQFPETEAEAARVERGRDLFTRAVEQGGAGCADCHHNGNRLTNGALDDTFQDFNIHEPGVVSESTVDGEGPFFRPSNDYFFTRFGPPQDVGTPQNFSSRNTKHPRTFWDAVPRYLHHGFAHTAREILLAPDSPHLRPGERGFNFRTVRADHRRGRNNLPTEVPITVAEGSEQVNLSLSNPASSSASKGGARSSKPTGAPSSKPSQRARPSASSSTRSRTSSSSNASTRTRGFRLRARRARNSCAPWARGARRPPPSCGAWPRTKSSRGASSTRPSC